MLKIFRKNTKSIVWAVVISFILWGGYSVGTQLKKESMYAGEVFGKSISHQEFNRFYRMAQLFSIGGEAISDPEMLRRQAWRNIIYSREAQKLGIEVKDNEVLEEIQKLFASQEIDQLTPEIYEQWLKRNVRMDARDFEEQLRELIRVQKLVREVAQAPAEVPTDEDVQKRYIQENTKITVSAAQYDNLETLDGLQEFLNSSVDWDQALSKFPPDNVEKISGLTLREMALRFSLEPELMAELHQHSPPHLFGPIPTENGFLLLQLEEIAPADPAKMDAETAKALQSQLLEERKRFQMIEWGLELLQRSRFRDYAQENKNGN